MLTLEPGCMYAQLCPALCDPMDYSPQAPLSMGFSWHRHWSGWPFPPPGDLPNLGIKLVSRPSLALVGGFFTTRTTWEAQHLWSHPQFPDGATPACQAPKGRLSLMLQTGAAPFLGLCWGHQVMCVQEPPAITP